MATSSNDLLLIHHHYPLLALLLSLCNPSSILPDFSLLNAARQADYEARLQPSTHSDEYFEMLGRVHKTLRPILRLAPLQSMEPEDLREHKIIKRLSFVPEAALHIIVAVIAAILVWQFVLLGMRSVFVYACWTWHEPFTWIGIGALVHILSFTFFRLCLTCINKTDPWYTKFSWSLSPLNLVLVSNLNIGGWQNFVTYYFKLWD